MSKELYIAGEAAPRRYLGQAATHFYDRAEETRRQGDLPYAAKLEAIAERHFAEQTASCPKGDDR